MAAEKPELGQPRVRGLADRVGDKGQSDVVAVQGRPAPEPEWDQQTQVWVRELHPDTLQLMGEEHIVWTGAVRGAVWAESPHLYRRGEHWYLMIAEGGTERGHGVSIARADDPRGPFTPGRVIDVSQAAARDLGLIGPGHATVTLALAAE